MDLDKIKQLGMSFWGALQDFKPITEETPIVKSSTALREDIKAKIGTPIATGVISAAKTAGAVIPAVTESFLPGIPALSQSMQQKSLAPFKEHLKTTAGKGIFGKFEDPLIYDEKQNALVANPAANRQLIERAMQMEFTGGLKKVGAPVIKGIAGSLAEKIKFLQEKPIKEPIIVPDFFHSYGKSMSKAEQRDIIEQLPSKFNPFKPRKYYIGIKEEDLKGLLSGNALPAKTYMTSDIASAKSYAVYGSGKEGAELRGGNPVILEISPTKKLKLREDPEYVEYGDVPYGYFISKEPISLDQVRILSNEELSQIKTGKYQGKGQWDWSSKELKQHDLKVGAPTQKAVAERKTVDVSYRNSYKIKLDDSVSADKIDIPLLKEKIKARNGYVNNFHSSALKKLEKLQNNPDADITIYRASPKHELNDGDWITTDKSYASYIKKQNGGEVYSYTVKVKDLRFPKDTETLPSLQMADTFSYSPKTSQLTPTQKAVAEGKTTQPIYYHGTPNADILQKEGFDLSKAGSTSGYKGTFGEGIYLTNNINRAKTYGDPISISVQGLKLKEISANKVLDELYTKGTKYGDPKLIKSQILAEGYDGIKIINKEKGMEELVIMKPELLKTKAITQSAAKPTFPTYKGEKNLTTKFLDYAKGKTTLSKQEIMDFAKRPELKRGEADLLLKKLEEFKDDYRYHTTSLKGFFGAQKEGLKPATGQYGKGVYFAPTEKLTKGYGSSEDIMIRIKKSKLPKDFDEFPEQGWTEEVVKPENLEYRLKNGKDWFDLKTNKKLSDVSKLSAQEFADSMRRDLLELKPVKVKDPQYKNTTIKGEGELYYTGKNYEEIVYESPIKTNGSTHYPNSEKYFANTRGDTVMRGKDKIKRVQEIQSDLLQKEGMDRQIAGRTPINANDINNVIKGAMSGKAQKEIDQLSPFTNDRFGERILREEIKRAAQSGHTKLQFPTGETIGKIEGFESEAWDRLTPEGKYLGVGHGDSGLTIENMKVGQMVTRQGHVRQGDEWIITDILGDGRFKAMQKGVYENFQKAKKLASEKLPLSEIERNYSNLSETFDLTGKNPQAIRYEKWGKFLKNKYEGKEMIDPQGNSWVEMDLKKEMRKMPIEAFGIIGGIGLTGKIGLPFKKKEENK